ncbi:MAG TPA: nicotinate phosphoribosyltransferase [Actinomycetota bacterium]|jgi:nicotinate phosphoribosyltransferase
MGRALLTDLYELTMAASYRRRGMDARATFSLYVRSLPPERGFLVAAGLDGCLEYLDGLAVADDDLEYLAGAGFDDASLGALQGLRFTGDVWAVPEGRIVFAGEPLLEVTAPVAEAQLAETALLNRITLETTLASKAARCVVAADGRDLLDFAFRRTHGPDAAMAVARTTAICGFAGTSNVEAARRFGLRTVGTMAHSYVEAFPSEHDAFRAFAEDFPGRATFLVDTYDTPAGVEAAIRVIRELGLGPPLGIRLDSGDVDSLARGARRALDDAGLAEVRIFASGGLDDLDVERLVRDGAPIDGFGLGTRLGVSADAPSLDTVYKMVEFDGRPTSKLSPGKESLPGRKQVFRGARPGDDVLGLRSAPAPARTWPMLVPVMARGTRLGPSEPLGAALERFREDLGGLPDPARRLAAPEAPEPKISDELALLARRVQDEMRVRSVRGNSDIAGRGS